MEDLKVQNVFAQKRKNLLNTKSRNSIKNFVTNEVDTMTNDWSGINDKSINRNYFNEENKKLTANKINEKINIQNKQLPSQNKEGLMSYFSFLNSLNKCSTQGLILQLLLENGFHLENQFDNFNKLEEHYYYNSETNFIICNCNKEYFIF